MICLNCNAVNDDEYFFCVNCGGTISAGSPFGIETDKPSGHLPPNSVATVVQPFRQYTPSTPVFNPATALSGENRTSKVGKISIWFGSALVVIALGAGAYYFLSKPAVAVEVMPEHLGMFVQSNEKDRVDEVKRQDVSNALKARDDLLKSETLPNLEPNPNLVLYADNTDVPINDLRLIQLDTIKDDGTMKQLDIQAAPVDGKPAMKRLRVPEKLANGKYAFALLDGFLNEGKHKFWPFQVRNSSKSDNGDMLKASSFPTKPKTEPAAPSTLTSSEVPAPRPPSATAPPGSTVAYNTTSRLVLRSGPSQTSPKIGNLARGQRVHIIQYSDNTEYFAGMNSRFAYIQTDTGRRGWVFAAYLR